ncbi:MAG TPA: T9SS type A sorting domain-containing protein [Flavobacteriales bacterium]|nr:T9SS type A sorting domain-containing protein [Flavobacteriales bacterium]HIO59037.1 T9SS type A sorting domain-containing protein [Flavobacteriales bacterium]
MKQSIPFVSLLLLLIAGLQSSIYAQQDVIQPSFSLSDIPQVDVEARVAKPMPTKSVDGFTESPQMPFSIEGTSGVEHIQTRALVVERQIIGLTQYDLQTNASIDDRLVGGGDALSAGWIMSLELTPFSDRGTGYNFNNGSLWGEQPYERIESVRVGWPSLVHTESGLEVSVTHPGIDTPLWMASREIGSDGAWAEMEIPSDGPFGNLWPRIAVGGPDGNTLHVICVSTPVGNGGELYQGQDGAMLYYRSMDAGSTWEQASFPQLDTTSFTGFDGDTYAIHARDGVVAFAVFNDFMDTFVMISEDNGDNWEYVPVIDFPVDNYMVDDGLPIDGGEDFDGDGIFQEYLNSDGSGDVHVDQYGQVHVVFGGMYYMDADTTDGTTSYFPGTNGLEYWNQSFDVDSSLTIAYAYDIDGSGTLDLEDDIAAYFVSLAGIPSIASSDNADLFVTYSAIREDYTTGSQNYRHLYVVNSNDNGSTWNTDDACDLTPDLDFDGYESVFASLSPDVSDYLDIIYQRDFEPGLHVRGDLDPVDLNDIVHLRLAVADLGDCADIEFEDWVGIAEPFSDGDVVIYPNPASSSIEIVIDRAGSHNVRILDLNGRIIREWATSSMVERVNITDFASGVYIVEVSQGDAHSVYRLAVD